MIIGITGTDGAGKGAAVDRLVRHYSFTHFSSRSVIEAEIAARGMEVNRGTMRLVANAMRSEFGNDVLIARALVKIREEAVSKAVVESVRTLEEAKTLRANGGILLAIDAHPKKRYQRISGRKSKTDNVTFAEFLAHEAIEMNDPDPHGMQKAAVMKSADYTIMNNGSMSQLFAKVADFLQQYED